MAATVILSSGRVIALTAIDADWTWTDSFPMEIDGIDVAEIVFTPGAVANKVAILDQNASGGHLFPAVIVGEVMPVKICFPPGTLLKPFIDFSECVLAAGHSVLIVCRHNIRK
jgi:hypothetical protein